MFTWLIMLNIGDVRLSRGWRLLIGPQELEIGIKTCQNKGQLVAMWLNRPGQKKFRI